MFKSGARLIPGKWQLIELYTETTSGLQHLKEADLVEQKVFLVLSFCENREFFAAGQCPFPVFNTFFEGEVEFVTKLHLSDPSQG